MGVVLLPMHSSQVSLLCLIQSTMNLLTSSYLELQSHRHFILIDEESQNKTNKNNRLWSYEKRVTDSRHDTRFSDIDPKFDLSLSILFIYFFKILTSSNFFFFSSIEQPSIEPSWRRICSMSFVLFPPPSKFVCLFFSYFLGHCQKTWKTYVGDAAGT